MRFDNVGLFWQDLPSSRKRGKIQRPRPDVPETGWKAPDVFPNLSAAVMLAIDTETHDPELLEAGPGWARGKGNICGFSVAAQDKHGNTGKWYFPIRHTDSPEENVDPENALAWLKHTLSDPRQAKIGANIIYDLGWLREEGVEVAGPVYDVQYAEALLHESARVGLDVLARKYLKQQKTTSLLYQWCADYYGGDPTDKQRKNIYRSPPSLVGPYGEDDAALPLEIIKHQWPLLEQDGLMDVFLMECELIPLLLDMRFAGVTVDLPRAEELYDRLGKESEQTQKKLNDAVGFCVNVNSNDDLGKAFDKVGIPYGRTPTKQPSMPASFLESLKHPIGQMVVDIKQREKLRGTFIKSYLLDNHVNGLVHGSFNPLRGDSSGTRSGRFSSSGPNLQNIPTRTAMGKEIRRLFIPDHDHVAWRKYDYSQIEYRFLAHYAVDNGDESASSLRQSYNDNPNVDYHQLIHDLILDVAGVDLSRGHTKNMNFGLIYGMGLTTLIQQLGVTRAKGKELYKAYHKGAPFAKVTADATMQEAQHLGYITTILGRRSRFDLWEPKGFNASGKPLPYDEASWAYPSLQRAYTHRALNRRLQGSAADQMKRAMLECYKSGVFAETGIPRLTVHDELDFSDPGGRDKAFEEMRRIMEECVPLRIPVVADGEIGPNWGDVKAIAA